MKIILQSMFAVVLILVWSVKPVMAAENPTATIETNFGKLKFELMLDKAPLAVSAFALLAESGFYKKSGFHLFSKGQFLKAGLATKANVGLDFCFRDEFHDELQHDRIGVLSLSNMGPNTNTGEFQITLSPISRFNGKNTVFGYLVDGANVLKKLQQIAENDVRKIQILTINVDSFSKSAFDRSKPNLNILQLEAIAGAQMADLVKNVGAGMGFGPVSELKWLDLRKICNRKQIELDVKYSKPKGHATFLIYGFAKKDEFALKRFQVKINE